MKKLIIILAMIIAGTNSTIMAENKKIELQPEMGNLGPRSIESLVLATHDKSTIQIHSKIAIERCRIKVIDSNNRTIYSEIVDLTPYQPHTFIINYNEKDTLLLEIGNEKVKYYGYFEII